MRRPQGYALWTGPGGVERERDTFTCAHCNRVCYVRPDPQARAVNPEYGFCRLCMKNVCGPCADLGTCAPFEKKLEVMERAHRFTETVGLVPR